MMPFLLANDLAYSIVSLFKSATSASKLKNCRYDVLNQLHFISQRSLRRTLQQEQMLQQEHEIKKAAPVRERLCNLEKGRRD